MVIITLWQPTLSNLLENAYKASNQVLVRLNINSYEIKQGTQCRPHDPRIIVR